MRSWGLQFDRRCVHAQVAEALKCSGLRPIISLGRKLVNLHDARNHADYDLGDDTGPDFDRLDAYWDAVRNGLLTNWCMVALTAKTEALDKMRVRIEQISRGVRE